MSNLFAFLFIASFICFIVGLIKPTLFKLTRKKVALFFGGAIIVFLILMGSTTKTEPKEENNIATITSTPEAKTTPESNPEPSKEPEEKYDYEILDRNENKTVENYMVLIKPGDDGKAIALEVQKECKKSCNIDIFDDKEALGLQKQYDDMMKTLNTTPEELQAWKEKNYVFVADHLVGLINFETPEEYNEYPFKDWHYEELKGKN